MRPRAAVLLLLSVAGLLLTGVGLSVRLLRAGLRTAGLATEQRLRAIGVTTAQALALSQGSTETLLDGVARENELEAAYLLDEALAPIPRAGGGSVAVSLLRIDPDRAMRALHGAASVSMAYHLEELDAAETTVLAGYFPVVMPGSARRLLVLEAGSAFVALPAQLRATAFAACIAAFGLAAMCGLLVMATLRAAAREKRLAAEAERGQAVRELSAMVAHELRNPLGTIRAGAELLREQAAAPELIDDILAEVARLSDLTTQFLQFSSDPPLQVSPLDLAALCDELCARLRREYRDETRLRLCREGDPEVPLCGDADRLRQVLFNLGVNALQAMAGSGTLTLSVQKLLDGGAELRVSDTGPGLGAEARQSLFVPFRTTKPSGTGLGLIVSRRIIEKHGGTLTVIEKAARAEKQGAAFLIRLPCRPPQKGLPDAPYSSVR